MDFRILQLQRIADSSIFWARILDFACNKSIFAWISDSSIFWARILDFACNKSIFAWISDSCKILTADLLNKS